MEIWYFIDFVAIDCLSNDSKFQTNAFKKEQCLP